MRFRFPMLLMLCLLPVILTVSCSDHNPDASLPDQPHPQNFILIHPFEAATDLTSCTFCHGADLLGTVGTPSCFACHTAANPLEVGDCRSCHNIPPDGRDLAGNVRPNRAGEHFLHVVEERFACSVCHFERGSGTLFHFDFEEPADVNFDRNVTGNDITFVQEDGNTFCAGRCHGEEHRIRGRDDDHRWY